MDSSPLRQHRIDNSLCRQCGNVRDENCSKTLCLRCLSIKKQRREDRKINGLCVECGLSKDSLLTVCDICRIKINKSHSNRQTLIVNKGLCRACKKERGQSSAKTLCSECAQQTKERSNFLKKENLDKKGLCRVCKNKKDTNTLRCNKCRIEIHLQYKQIKKVNNNNGLCGDCNNIRYFQSNSCRHHYAIEKGFLCGFNSLNSEILVDKLESTNFECFYTGFKIIPGETASIDHIKPRSKYPDLASDINNIVWCDFKVNALKRDLSYEQFVDFCVNINQKKYVSKESKELAKAIITHFNKGKS